MILAATSSFNIDIGLLTGAVALGSSLIGVIVSTVTFTMNTDIAFKSLKKDIKDLRRDTLNSVVHLEGLTRDMQYYLHEATKDNSSMKTYYIREHQTGHTGADFLKDE